MRLYWPVTDDTPQDAAHGSDAGVDLSGRMLIIVDDDLQVGEVMARYLEARGAEVAQVEDPQDALDAIAEDPEAWSAMITDYDMPRMNGGALAQRAAAAAPGLPIIVVTALARRLNDPRLERAQVRDILSKPVDLALLGARVAQVTEDDAATNDKAPDAPSGQE
jgi:DNA-binding NtrC family response regulator